LKRAKAALPEYRMLPVRLAPKGFAQSSGSEDDLARGGPINSHQIRIAL
jgi:hypothetical protein